MKALFSLGFAAVLVATSPISAGTHEVASADDLQALLARAVVLPGDVIVWKDGTYAEDQAIHFQGVSGTASAPVTLRAQTPGGVIFTGQASLRLGGEYLTVEGFRFLGKETSSVIQFRSSGNVEARHCRVTNCTIANLAVDGENTSKWVQFYGVGHQLDHCTLRGKTSRGAMVIVELGSLGSEESANHRIEYNYLADVPFPSGANPKSVNEFEGLRIGTSGDHSKPANCLVQFNLFENVDADPEVISDKSTGNRYLYNTIRRCAGQFVLRHGSNSTVAGNFILGEGKPGTGGIRVVGTGHRIYNNYIAGLRVSELKTWTAGLSLMAGSSKAPANGYVRPEGVALMFNTLYDCDVSIVIGEGLGGDGRPAAPRNCAFENNLIVSERGPLIIHKGNPEGILYTRNIGHGSATGITVDPSGINPVDPAMTEEKHLYRPAVGGPAANRATAAHPEVVEDVNGQKRPEDGRDIGADEVAGGEAGVPRRPLLAEDVGARF
jgi:poly(beta-D-mannuronate) lyase